MKRKQKIWEIILLIMAAVILFCVIAAVIGLRRAARRRSGGYYPSEDTHIVTDDGSIGSVKIATLPLEEGLLLQRATYTFSGRVFKGFQCNGYMDRGDHRAGL